MYIYIYFLRVYLCTTTLYPKEFCSQALLPEYPELVLQGRGRAR